MDKHSDNKEVVSYYKRSGWLYKYFWYSPKSLGMHCGFWDKDTKNRDKAIINQFKFIFKKAKIEKNMKVLDVGCGVGGGAIYIAKNSGAMAMGITISLEQVEEAKRNAVLAGVTDLVDFRCMDFMKMDFSDDTFDLVFGIESVCYAYPKNTFLNEVYRVLKPGGKLIINDGYIKRELVTIRDKYLRDSLCHGWRMKELVHFEYMSKAIKDAGFNGLVVEDKAIAVRPTLHSIGNLIRWFSLPLAMFNFLRIDAILSIRDNIQSLATLSEGDEANLFGYYSHMAYKPEK